jgi:hypothetical protein
MNHLKNTLSFVVTSIAKDSIETRESWANTTIKLQSISIKFSLLNKLIKQSKFTWAGQVARMKVGKSRTNTSVKRLRRSWKLQTLKPTARLYLPRTNQHVLFTAYYLPRTIYHVLFTPTFGPLPSSSVQYKWMYQRYIYTNFHPC